MEETFVNKNAVTTLRLGQARGIVLMVPARAGLAVAEYLPNLVKKSVVGSGHAAKEQVQMMVRRAFAERRPSPPPMPPTRSPSPYATRIIARRRAACAGTARMIAKLSGLVDAVGDGSVVIDVGGVGYLVSVPPRRCPS